jgi:hypothetical protein
MCNVFLLYQPTGNVFSPGNPDNANVQDGFFDSFFGEDCVEISLKSKYRGQLNDYHCEERMPFICKKKGKSG